MKNISGGSHGPRTGTPGFGTMITSISEKIKTGGYKNEFKYSNEK